VATTARPNGVPEKTYRLVRDMYRVFAQGAYWLWTRLWRLNRGLARTFLPGQHRGVQKLVAFVILLAELVALIVLAANFAATH
jgi:hypothetical protein